MNTNKTDTMSIVYYVFYLSKIKPSGDPEKKWPVVAEHIQSYAHTFPIDVSGKAMRFKDWNT